MTSEAVEAITKPLVEEGFSIEFQVVNRDEGMPRHRATATRRRGTRESVIRALGDNKENAAKGLIIEARACGVL